MISDFGYWTRVGKRILYCLGSIILVIIAFKFTVFYIPFLIAFLISQLMEPAIKILMKKSKLSRKLSAIIIFSIVLVIIIGALVWATTTLISETTNLLQWINEAAMNLYKFIQSAAWNFELSQLQISDELLNIFQNSGNNIINETIAWSTRRLNDLINFISSMPTIAIYAAITILATYFISTEKIYILDQLEHHLPKKWVNNLGKHIREIMHSLGYYLKAEFILVGISFVISVVGLYIYKFMGYTIEFPLLIAIGIAIVDALPILGSGTIMVPWGIGVAAYGDLNFGIAIIGLWIAMSLVRQFIEPRIVSKNIRCSSNIYVNSYVYWF